jgi:hypothetical protein
LNRVSIAAVLGGVVSPANEFCCDGGTAIVAFARRAAIAAHILPMPGQPKSNAPDFHFNNVNAYHSRLKAWLRRFHWRRHEKPAELSRLAPDPGGAGTERHLGRHDPRSYRTGTLSTDNAIRANFLDGRLDGDRIIFPSFTVSAGSAPGADAALPGASFAVRPQTITMHRTEPAAKNDGWWVEGKVVECAYLGECWEYVVRSITGDLRLRVITSPDAVYHTGETVWLEIDPRVLPVSRNLQEPTHERCRADRAEHTAYVGRDRWTDRLADLQQARAAQRGVARHVEGNAGDSATV